MPKISDCDQCLFYSHNYHLVCAPRPAGPEGDNCPDFQPDPDAQTKRFEDFLGLQWETGAGMEDYETPVDNPLDLDPDEEPWQPERAIFVNGGLVIERDAEGASPLFTQLQVKSTFSKHRHYRYYSVMSTSLSKQLS